MLETRHCIYLFPTAQDVLVSTESYEYKSSSKGLSFPRLMLFAKVMYLMILRLAVTESNLGVMLSFA